jgi:hypothetical protein
MLTEITPDGLDYIACNMREVDQAEIYNLLAHDNWVRFSWEAYHLILNNGRGRLAWHNGRPCGIGAFTECRPGVWDVWMLGTNDFRAGAVPLLRWGRKEANDILSVCKGIRLQCDSRVGHPEAHKMITAMGGLPEGPPMTSYGKDGSAYQRYVWLPGENDAVLKPGFVRAA